MLRRLAVMAAVGFTVLAVKEDLGTPFDCLHFKRGYYAKGCSAEYWACAGKKLFNLKCGPGFYFNPTNNKCDDKDNVPGCTQDERECANGSFVAHISGCSAIFWYCSQGKLQNSVCPSGTYFNPTRNVCDFHKNIRSCSGGSDDYMDPTPKSADPSGSDDYMDSPPKSSGSDDYMDPTPHSANSSGSDDYMDPSPRSAFASHADDYMDPTPRSADASRSDDYMDSSPRSDDYMDSSPRSDDYMDPSPRSADASHSDDYMDSTPRSDDYMDSSPRSDDYMDPAPGSADSSASPTKASSSSSSPIDCLKMGNGYHSKGCSRDSWYCNHGQLEAHVCAPGTFFNSLSNLCDSKELVLACSGEPDYPSGADYPEEPVTETPSTPRTTMFSTTPSAPTKPPTTVAAQTGDKAATMAPVMAIHPMVSEYHKHSYTTFLGITVILFSILCILYLLCGNANFTCSASINVGSSATSPDSLQNTECKKSGMYNIV